jgi:positive control factor
MTKGRRGRMRVLLLEYKQSLREVRRMVREADKIEDIDAADKEKAILMSMERDLLFAIDWMSTGRCPDSYKGVDHKKAYEQKSFPPSFFNRLEANNDEVVEEEDNIKGEALEFLLKDLSELEKDIFTVIKMGYSNRGAESLLGIKKSKINRIYKSAEEKVMKRAAMIRI